MQYNQLGKSGLKVSSLSFGASALGGVFRPVDEGEAIRAVHAALDYGINYFDVAPAYGATRSETVLGKALRGSYESVTSFQRKLGNTQSQKVTAKTRWTTRAIAFGNPWRRAPRALGQITSTSSISTTSSIRGGSTRTGG